MAACLVLVCPLLSPLALENELRMKLESIECWQPAKLFWGGPAACCFFFISQPANGLVETGRLDVLHPLQKGTSWNPWQQPFRR